MTQTDQLKVMRAGFMIIRRDYQNLLIKFKDRDNVHWKTWHSGFASKAALDREMKELLQKESVIED